jgi:hypothetical protein
MTTLIWFIIGLILGAAYCAIGHRSGKMVKGIFGSGLIVAALIYLGFALRADASLNWYGIELLGVIVYGGLGLAGIRGSAWLLAVGWGLHSIWDAGVHYLGPGHALVPGWYAMACLSFDFTVAGYIAYAINTGANPALKTQA